MLSPPPEYTTSRRKCVIITCHMIFWALWTGLVVQFNVSEYREMTDDDSISTASTNATTSYRGQSLDGLWIILLDVMYLASIWITCKKCCTKKPLLQEDYDKAQGVNHQSEGFYDHLLDNSPIQHPSIVQPR